MTAGIIIIAIIAIVGLWFVSTQRSLVQLDENCKNALSQIQVQLNSRWDALLALAKTASQYAKHESETLINVINARRQAPATTAEAVNEQQGLTHTGHGPTDGYRRGLSRPESQRPVPEDDGQRQLLRRERTLEPYGL